MTTTDNNAAQAARILHEDQISANVERVRKQIAGKAWTLFHARDYLLGVLHLLEAAHLLRDLEQEAADQQRHREALAAFGPASTPREKAYALLLRAAAPNLPPSFAEAVQRAAGVRTDEEMKAAKPSALDVAAWAHGGSTADALALARVRRLAESTWPRKTIPRQALLDALQPPGAAEDAA
jgi:hypothetical protein